MHNKKSFSEYLIESHQVYKFKIKLAGDYCNDAACKKINQALGKFDAESCSSGKRIPIQKTHEEFPEHENICVTMFDCVLNYPATSQQVREAIKDSFKISDTCVKVCSEGEQYEYMVNHQFDEISDEPILGSDYEKEDNSQDLVGGNRIMSLLKELEKTKHDGTQIKGYNDKILAKSAPREKSKGKGPAAKAAKINGISIVGSRKVTLPARKPKGK